MLCGLGAKSAELWPFSEVNNRLVLSVNGGYHFDKVYPRLFKKRLKLYADSSENGIACHSGINYP